MHRSSHLFLITMVLAVFFVMIDTSVGATTRDDAIKQSIQREAGSNPALRAAKVKIAVENGSVVLYGTVSRYIQKMIYERIAWKTADVLEVDNEIRVIPLSPLNDAAIERQIKEIIQTHRQFLGADVDISVNAGAVKVLIVLNHPAEILFLKKKIAEIDGVISVDISAQFIPIVRFDPRLDGAAQRPTRAGYSSVQPA